MVRLFWVMGHSLICDLSNVAIVVISSVLHMLSSTIWEGYRVRTRDSLAIGGFTSTESSLGVIISNSIFIGVRLWRVFRLLVCRGRVVGCRSRFVDRLMHNNWGGLVGRRWRG